MRRTRILAGALMLAACSAQSAPKKEAKMPVSQSQITFAPFVPDGYQATGDVAPDAQVPEDFGTGPQLFWIRSEAGFARFGYARTGTASASQAPGEPDFAKQDVINITMGVQGTTGYDIRLESIRVSGQEIRFLAKIKAPSPKDAVGEALTHPAQLVVADKLPRDAKPIVVFDGKEVKFDLHVLE